MPLTKDKRKAFYNDVKRFFKHARFGTTEQILAYFQTDNRKLAQRLKKESKKIGPIIYIGRYLMRPITHEGWVKHDGKKWMVEPVEGFCTYCLVSLDKVYVLDANHHQYCDFDCMDRLEAEYLEDGYGDEYAALFADFHYFSNKYSSFLGLGEPELESIYHQELCQIIEDLEEWFDYAEFDHIYLNGGDDGAIAAEMYRMLTTMESSLEELRAIDERVSKALDPQREI